MKTLYVIRDYVNLKDKGSDLYTKALQKRGSHLGYRVEIVTETTPEVFLLEHPNSIILKPNGFDNDFIDLDENLTAQAVFEIIKEIGSQLTVTILNRSNLIGLPLAKMLIDNDYTVTIAHSKSCHRQLQDIIENSDVVVSAAGKHLSYTCFKPILIDVSNDFDRENCWSYYDRGYVGNKTIELLFKKLEGI